MCENLKLINTQFSGNPKRAHEILSKAIELAHDEEELARLVRERLVATIMIERRAKTNEALCRILHLIYTDAKNEA